jgi:hypothetical protein
MIGVAMSKRNILGLFTTVKELKQVNKLQAKLGMVIGKGLRDYGYELKCVRIRERKGEVKSFINILKDLDGRRILELNIPLVYTKNFRSVKTRFAIENNTGDIYLLRQAANITAFRDDIGSRVAEKIPDRRVRLNDCGKEKDNWLWVCQLTRASVNDIIKFIEAVEKCRDDMSEKSGKRRTLSNEIIEIMKKKILETEKSQLIKARLGQGIYRQHLIQYWDGCAVTGCKNLQMLVASHIKPWSECRNGKEKLDKYNGLLLVPNLDRAFDEGYITFDDKGRIIISKALSKAECKLLSVDKKMRLSKTDALHRRYLEYHRQNVFTGV